MDQQATYSRWSAWEEQVLARVDPSGECREVIRRRQEAVDDDAEEADLVADQFRQELRRCGHDPEAECVFLPSGVAADWLRAAPKINRPTNRATSHLKSLCIDELSKTKKDGSPGWRWRGPNGPEQATMARLNNPTKQ